MTRISVRSLIPLLLLLIFIVHFADSTESDPKGSNEDGADLSGAKLAPPDTNKAEDEKKEETKMGIEEERSKETLIMKKDETSEEGKPKVEENVKGSLNGDLHVEECDPSNRCDEEKSEFVACLRVPGLDSLDLSLLVQNKGRGTLDVSIIAPEFVELEQNTVQLKAKENKEVRVSVKDNGNDTVIVLKAGEGACNLNFHNMVSNSLRKSETASQPRHFGQLSQRFSPILIVISAMLLIGSAWSCIRYRKMKIQVRSQYHEVDMGLPISVGGKKDANENDGWDNTWGDDWGDEEAPTTPSKPVSTPSSKGLASRMKLSKDSWKD